MEKSDFLLWAPKSYVARKPDTIITVIDLERWQIVDSIHTASTADSSLRGARIVSDKWLVLDGNRSKAPTEHGAYRFHDRLYSIPDLKPGPNCVSERFSAYIGPPPEESAADSVSRQNNTACSEVFQATGVTSADALEDLIYRKQNVEPEVLKVHMLDFVDDSSMNTDNDKRRVWEADEHERDFFRWGEYPYYRLYTENPAFESAAHLWYGLYDARDHGLYKLGRYDSHGHKQMGQTIRHLLCGDRLLEAPNSACGCRVVDVSEQQRALLVYCRTQRGNFDGMVRREWLSVFRSDDLSEVGLINLSKNETLEAIASGDGHAYIVTVEFGKILRIYAIPSRT